MNAAPLHLAGERLLLDPAGVLLWPAQRMMVAADLHLEKGSAMAGRGQLVPPWDSAATLDRLARAVHRHRPERLVLLGDSFHDRHGADRLAPRDRAALAGLGKLVSLDWVLGNHDPVAQSHLPGRFAGSLAEGAFVFRHQALASVPATGLELSGHFHPKARVATRAGSIARPCFVVGRGRIILPAFGAFTGGLDVGHAAIARLFPRGGRVFLLGRERLFSFTLAQAQGRVPAQPSPSGPEPGRSASVVQGSADEI